MYPITKEVPTNVPHRPSPFSDTSVNVESVVVKPEDTDGNQYLYTFLISGPSDQAVMRAASGTELVHEAIRLSRKEGLVDPGLHGSQPPLLCDCAGRFPGDQQYEAPKDKSYCTASVSVLGNI